MFFSPTTRVGVWVLIFGAVFALPLTAQSRTAPAGHSAVDVVSLKSGRTLRGAIVGQQPDGKLLMAVSLDWYRESNPTTVATVVAENLEQRRVASTQARDRISDRLKSNADTLRLAGFLQQELERIDQSLADRNPPDPDFLWIEVAPQTVTKVAKATPEQQQIALFAWNEGLSNVETKDVAALKKELVKKAVNLSGPPPDLSDRLSARPQEDREWNARLALIEYTLLKPLDFQGIGDTLTRTHEGQAINLGEILPKMLQRQLGSFLMDLTNDNASNTKSPNNPDFLKPAIRDAESAKIRGFRVTRVAIDSVAYRVSVESQFVGQVSPGVWQTVWRSVVTEDGTKVRPAAEGRIEQDPQVKSAIDTLKTLGLFDMNTLQQAIRIGAATMTAEQSAEGFFVEYRDRYVRRLDGPPLQVVVDK